VAVSGIFGGIDLHLQVQDSHGFNVLPFLQIVQIPSKLRSFSILVGCDKYSERHQREGASPSLWTPTPWGTDCLSPTPPRQLLRNDVLRLLVALRVVMRNWRRIGTGLILRWEAHWFF
jgi:hypothetical protein